MLVGEAGGRRRAGVLAAALIALIGAMALPAVASAEEFTVDSTADEVDAISGNAACLTAGGKCTLRAAIEEANRSIDELDQIRFDESVFDGGATGTITLGSSLPPIVDPVIVNGGECMHPGGISGPCAGVAGPAAGPAFVVEAALATEIEGLAITGAQTGIEVVDGELVGISSNWIGVKLDGAPGGNSTGVVFRPGADNGRIGGQGPGRGNVFADNTGDGVDLLGGSHVRVLRNRFGVNPDGSDPGAVEELAILAGAEAEADIAGNQILAVGAGIRASGSTGAEGNLIEGNLIEGTPEGGIVLENDRNKVIGNEIVGSGGTGIEIVGSTGAPSTGNLIGGDTEEEENAIFESSGDAIGIVDVEASENEVARNWGAENNGLFIDLVAASPGTEPNGPNDGIEPPPFSAATESGASGSGARAGAHIRVFSKASSEAGELEWFLGEATADGGGNWKVAYDAAIPAGTIVAASQTSEAGGTSELSTAVTTATPSGGGGGGGGGNGGSGAGGGGNGAPGASSTAEKVAPQAKITKGPKAKSHSATAKFVFESDESGSTFQCKLDGKPFKACKSPKKYKKLKPGKHVFKVRAVNSAGVADPTPVQRKFQILP